MGERDAAPAFGGSGMDSVDKKKIEKEESSKINGWHRFLKRPVPGPAGS
jgi:hypothetical protein